MGLTILTCVQPLQKPLDEVSYDNYEIHRCEDDLFLNLFATQGQVKQACKSAFHKPTEQEIDERLKKAEDLKKSKWVKGNKPQKVEWLEWMET